MKLFSSKEADEFLYNLFEYIAIEKQAPESANKVVSEIQEGIQILKESPKMGTKLKGENIRFLVIGNYVAVYEIAKTHITITNYYGKGQNWR